MTSSRLPQKRQRLALFLGLLLALAFGVSTAQAAATYLLAYPKAPYDGASGTYTLTADGTSVDVTAYYSGRYSFGHVAFEGTTTFALSTRNGAAITSFNISPHSYGLNANATVSGSTLTFSVTQANSTYLIISVSTSAGALEPMVIAGDPKETGAPTIGGSVKDITASPYNADKTGATLLNTTIQNAINAVSSGGGGTVYFPPGVYEISNNIMLKSNVTLYLAPGAFIRGSSNRSDYTWNTSPLQNGQPEQGPQNFIIPGGTSNVAFTGRGVIDANSTVLVTPATTGGTIDGFGNYRKGIISSKLNGGTQPNGITISGITVKDATTWTFDIEDALNVTVQNVKMCNDFKWIHSDGYDICSVTNATVDNCLGVTGDDVFDGKVSSTNPLSNVTYSNNVAYSWEGDGCKVGDQASGSANNVVFSNIEVVAGQRACSVSHDEDTGSWSGIHFNDIHLENLEGTSSSGEFLVAPIVIWTLGGGAGPVTNVDLCRVIVDSSNGHMSEIEGYDSSSAVTNVTLQDVSIDGTAITSSTASSKITVGSNVSGLSYGLVSGGIYNLVSEYNGLAMDNGNTTTNGAPVLQGTPNGGNTQSWQLTSVGSGVYTIISQMSGHALDNSSSGVSGFGMEQWGPNGGTQQKWQITSIGSGNYKVVSAQSGLYLDDDHTTTSGSQLVQFTNNGGGSTQQWILTKE